MAHGSGRWCAHSADEGPVHGQAAAMAEVAFRRVRPGEAVPPPPPELVKWGNDTLLATLLGMGYGASLAYRAREVPTGEVSQQVCTPASSPRLRSHHALCVAAGGAAQHGAPRASHSRVGLQGTWPSGAEAARAGLTVARCAQIGAFAAVFLGTQTYLKLQRSEPRWTDVAVAGAGTAGLFGTLCASVCARHATLSLHSPRPVSDWPHSRQYRGACRQGCAAWRWGLGWALDWAHPWATRSTSSSRRLPSDSRRRRRK